MLTAFNIPVLSATADDDEDDANDDYDHVDYDADDDHMIKFDVICKMYGVCCMVFDNDVWCVMYDDGDADDDDDNDDEYDYDGDV